ncbi:histidine kinase [Chitinimonas arctica]|uniref:histidine kinase n=1 Tax=Chitinimonas arctica TaxID=2594795 RepID=A0A516SHI5_9NEIS|nr:ATP-binding protein [Chitinimonas arctica]QDQ27603.1 histidine kinase [Chitinimonas arctica]
MKLTGSIRARLILGAAVVLLAFLAGAGLAVQQAHADSVRTARFDRLQSTVYLLLAAAELDASGGLTMPLSLAEPRLSLPASGLYANITNPSQREEWQSPSTLSMQVPFPRKLAAGEWRFDELERDGRGYLAAAFGVKWGEGRTQPLTFSVVEDKAAYSLELSHFHRTLWSWLGGAGVVLLLTQTVLLGWGLAPLRRVAREIRRIETGRQARVEEQYPAEIAGLTDNLNALIEQERARQTRYKDALGDLAHSLKTPLAVLRGALADPASLAETVEQQVARMDGIVQHQLGRAAASGAARFAPPLQLQPVLRRILESLGKVYADKGMDFQLDCPDKLLWRMDEGDAFEVFGNLLDNAAKWAKGRVRVQAQTQGKSLLVTIEDDGPGFSDPDAALQRGVRLDERVPGHGIGLTVVADIVGAHGGQLELSRGEWGGGLVRVVLKLA